MLLANKKWIALERERSSSVASSGVVSSFPRHRKVKKILSTIFKKTKNNKWANEHEAVR